MPTTPGESPLSATEEAGEIKYSFRDSCTVDTIERPTAERVLQVLPGYSIAHFACHGVALVNPANSHLLLLKESISHDGLCTEEVDKLCVKDIAALKLPAARLAYLPALSTAKDTSSKLIDEITDNPAEDEACQKMAIDFYSMLRGMDDVAISYRTAILGLMKQKPLQPMFWAPFIHFGA